MKTANKIIMSGLAAFLMSCSNESTSPDVTGATTEPNASPTAQLTPQQIAVLAKSFYSLVDSSKGIPDSNHLDQVDFETYPFKVVLDQGFDYTNNSKDGRRTCEVVTFSEEYGKTRPGVIQALSYDARKYVSEQVLNDPKDASKFTKGGAATLVATKFIEVDGNSIIMQTVGNDFGKSYWGYGVSCSEYLDQFKQACTESNGLFRDFADGCRDLKLSVACASFAPEGASVDELKNSYIEDYKNSCVADSISYAPFDDENYVYEEPEQPVLNKDSVREAYTTYREWHYSLYTPEEYLSQFIPDSSDEYLDSVFKEFDFHNTTGEAYNVFPDAEGLDSYREEGVYRLPDSLVAVFFPTIASSPKGLQSSESVVYYMLVLKDVGVKGHMMTDISKDMINVVDIVKGGESCPEDTVAYYMAFLLNGSLEWKIAEKPVVRKTFVSPAWNCNDAESLERVQPHTEWTRRYGDIMPWPDLD